MFHRPLLDEVKQKRKEKKAAEAVLQQTSFPGCTPVPVRKEGVYLCSGVGGGCEGSLYKETCDYKNVNV